MADIVSLLMSILLVVLLLCSVGLHIFSMPGNWVMLAIIGLWQWLYLDEFVGWWVILMLIGLAAMGELLELGAQILGTKKFGGSNRGNVAGIIGAIVGAILGAPFFLGIGAVIGALLGAFGGCFLVELGQGKSADEAAHAALGAFLGKFFGMFVKVAFGLAMIAIFVPRAWMA